MSKKILSILILAFIIVLTGIYFYNHKYYPQNQEELKALVENPLISLDEINTSKITDMSYMFKEAKFFNQPLDKWDTSEVKLMFGDIFKDSPLEKNPPKWY